MFIPILLLPPSISEFLPEDHLAHLIDMEIFKQKKMVKNKRNGRTTFSLHFAFLYMLFVPLCLCASSRENSVAKFDNTEKLH